jgi:hypothetical protein
MSKQVVSFFAVMLIAVGVFGQSSETVTDAQAQKTFEKLSSRAFKPAIPNENKTDLFTVTGIGSVSFSTANTGDGTYNSYNHSQKIVMPLQVSSAKLIAVSLVFYSAGDKIPYAATVGDEGVTAYYPLNLYEEIRQRIEQGLAAKKKVQLKITQKTDSFREAVLIF